MTVGNYNLSQIWPQIAKFQHQIINVVVILLVLYLIAFAAELTWRLLPEPDSETAVDFRSATNIGDTKGNGQQINLAKVKRLNLFGDMTAKPVEVKQTITDAPETRLNLSLNGVVSSTNKSVAIAIIENRGQQSTYGIEEKIEGTNAILKEVYADRVIIKNGPRRETLMLDGVDFNTGSEAASLSKAVINKNKSPQGQAAKRTTLPREVADATRELQSRPSEFSDYIAISPYRQDGRLEGYRISPGKKPKLFKAAGFKAGDVVVEINGLDLTDPQQSLEAMNSLRSAQSLQLTVNRGDETLTLYLDFPSAGLNI